MKWSELRRIVERSGWLLVRYGRRHDVYEKNGREIYIERHASAEVRKGVFHGIIK